MKLPAYVFAFLLPLTGDSRADRGQPAPACSSGTALEGYVMTFDHSRSRVVIFGGGTASGALSGDTWGWDGRTWSCLVPATASGPSGRSAATLAYDAERQAVVLYGGRLGREGLRDTWELSAAGWSRKHSAGPTPDPHGVMAFDAATHAVLLYNSLGDDTPARATWKWDGAEWSRITSEPPKQFPNAMFASNGSRPALLMTARSAGTPDAYEAPVYEWRKNEWKELRTTGTVPVFSPQAPAARTVAGAVLYAGFEPNGEVSTFVLHGAKWHKYAGVSPSRRRGAQMVFDARRGVVVLHGGDDGKLVLSDTWEWNGNEWKRF